MEKPVQTLWAPWRIEYILGPKPDECIFCLPEDSREDENNFILYRALHCFVMLNRYPYNNGHLMVTPYRHVYSLSELDSEEAHELITYIQYCEKVLFKSFSPDGINVGLNIGQAAGAGIEEHLHFHLVPRWNGDHSFMAVFGETMVNPEHLRSAYKRLKPYFEFA
jgi:ATP adenylyltransferase